MAVAFPSCAESLDAFSAWSGVHTALTMLHCLLFRGSALRPCPRVGSILDRETQRPSLLCSLRSKQLLKQFCSISLALLPSFSDSQRAGIEHSPVGPPCTNPAGFSAPLMWDSSQFTNTSAVQQEFLSPGFCLPLFQAYVSKSEESWKPLQVEALQNPLCLNGEQTLLPAR